MANLNYNTGPLVNLINVGTNERGLIVNGEKLTSGAPTTLAPNFFEVGCIITSRATGVAYINTGTVAVPVWSVFSTGTNGGAYQLLGQTTLDLDAAFGYVMSLSGVVGTFQVGEQISDGSGNTALVSVANGSDLTLYSVNFMSPPFSGTITGGSSGATGNFVSLSAPINDSQITLTGGTRYVITDVVITNASTTPANLMMGSGLQIWDTAGRSGVQIANVQSMANLSYLDNANKFFNHLSVAGTYQVELYPPNMIQNAGTRISTAYISVATPNGSPCTVDVYVYGYVIN